MLDYRLTFQEMLNFPSYKECYAPMSDNGTVQDKIERVRKLLTGDALQSVNRDILELTDIVDDSVLSIVPDPRLRMGTGATNASYAQGGPTQSVGHGGRDHGVNHTFSNIDDNELIKVVNHRVQLWLEKNLMEVVKKIAIDTINERDSVQKKKRS